jgi:hypothetical protein
MKLTKQSERLVMLNRYGGYIDSSKAMLLANLVLLAIYKNRQFTERLVCGKDELADAQFFPEYLSVSDKEDFEEDASNHGEHISLKVHRWLWHTEKPAGLTKCLRTLPFGFIAEDAPRKEIYIVFRGTITSAEWRKNAAFRLRDSYQGSSKLGLVHGGFESIFSSDFYDRLAEKGSWLTRIRQSSGGYPPPPLGQRHSIKEAIHETVIDSNWLLRGYRIYTAGHSLGGALAMLSAQLLLSHDIKGYQDALSICTFGAPRTGNNGFAEWFNDVEVVRYVNSEDIVPTLPPSTGKVFGADMNEVNVDMIRAERQKAYRRLDWYFASTKGEMELANSNLSISDERALDKLKTFQHVGEARCFTLNKGSISYNHNMNETYRLGINMAR